MTHDLQDHGVVLAFELPQSVASILVNDGDAESGTVVRAGAITELTRLIVEGLGPASEVVTVTTGLVLFCKALARAINARRSRAATSMDIRIAGPSGSLDVHIDGATVEADALRVAIETVGTSEK